MSNTSKGNHLEITAKGILEKMGYEVFRQHRKVMFKGPGKMRMVGADFFGCDLIAKKPGEKPLWIQVSTIENKSTKIKEIMRHVWNWEYERVQVWGWVKRKGFRFFEAPDFEEIGVEGR